MNKPILYIKTGCPYCKVAMEYLDKSGIDYETIDVLAQPEKMSELRELSGQTRTPTLKWNGDVLANFGVNELRKFLADRASVTN